MYLPRFSITAICDASSEVGRLALFQGMGAPDVRAQRPWEKNPNVLSGLSFKRLSQMRGWSLEAMTTASGVKQEESIQ